MTHELSDADMRAIKASLDPVEFNAEDTIRATAAYIAKREGGEMTEAEKVRGYAELGAGAYIIDHSRAGEIPELCISLATPEQRARLTVGDSEPNPEGSEVQASDMVVRLRFTSERGLFALEEQLRMVREVHFPAALSSAPQPAAPDAGDRIGITVRCTVCGHSKTPIGRSVALGMHMCDDECYGYRQEPLPGSLWPGEKKSEFGYACGDEGTIAAPREGQATTTELLGTPKLGVQQGQQSVRCSDGMACTMDAGDCDRRGYCLNDGPSTPSTVAGASESGACWLIESLHHQPPQYWSAGNGGGNWSLSPNHAVRFKRASDALSVMAWARLSRLVDARPVEHVWMDRAPTPSDPVREALVELVAAWSHEYEVGSNMVSVWQRREAAMKAAQAALAGSTR